MRVRIYRVDAHVGARPARLDVIESLRRLGPSTVRELATDTGRYAASVSSIVRHALRVGLVEIDPERQVTGKRLARRYRLAVVEVECLPVEG